MLKALWSKRPGKRSIDRKSEHLSINDLKIIWRKSKRRTRSLALKVDRKGEIIAMTPMATSRSEVARFVRSREAWIRRQLAQHEQLEADKQAERGQRIWFMGEQLKVENLTGRKNIIQFEPGLIKCISRQPLDAFALDKRLSQWLREQAGLSLPLRLEKLSGQTGMRGSALQIKSYTARWGSCRHDGLIQLNWKLIKTPTEVIDYVIIHELSHLSHFNHSASFWGLVGQHCPDYQPLRKWLKDNGRLLIAS